MPALAESKWSVYSSIPLAGVIGRILSVLPFFILVCLFLSYIYRGRIMRFDYFVGVSLVLLGALGGSKIFFLKYFFILYLAYFGISKVVSAVGSIDYINMVKNKWILYFVGIVSLLLVFILVYFHQLYTRSLSLNPVILVLERLVMSGDLQALGFPNSVVDSINHGEDLFSIIFYELKGFLSVLGFTIVGNSIGLKVMQEVYPHWDVNVGPASTFDVFFYVYFKNISLFLCFIVGAFVGLISTLRIRFKSEFQLIAYVIFVFGGYTIIYNPQIWLSDTIFNFIFFFCFYIFIKFWGVVYEK